jgi:hypothetical protein
MNTENMPTTKWEGCGKRSPNVYNMLTKYIPAGSLKKQKKFRITGHLANLRRNVL